MNAMRFPAHVRVFEVGPRDGLQNETKILSLEERLAFVQRLEAAGLRDIEIGAFVHPKWVPQMTGTDDLARALPRRQGVRYWALVPNERGLDRALEVGITHVCLLASASETHSRKNLNRSIAESHDVNERVARLALEAGAVVRGYVSTVFGCPYEGAVPIEQALAIAQGFLDMGAAEISLGDTVGMGHPLDVRRGTEQAVRQLGAEHVALHLHDTRGLGLTNVFAALDLGVTTIDASSGGIGGCPYAPGASGNLATEDLVHLLHGLGVETGVDLDALVLTSHWLEHAHGIVARSPYARYARSRVVTS